MKRCDESEKMRRAGASGIHRLLFDFVPMRYGSGPLQRRGKLSTRRNALSHRLSTGGGVRGGSKEFLFPNLPNGGAILEQFSLVGAKSPLVLEHATRRPTFTENLSLSTGGRSDGGGNRRPKQSSGCRGASRCNERPDARGASELFAFSVLAYGTKVFLRGGVFPRVLL